jgi:hypothetical protein
MDPTFKSIMLVIGATILGGLVSWAVSSLLSGRANTLKLAETLATERKTMAEALDAERRSKAEALDAARASAATLLDRERQSRADLLDSHATAKADELAKSLALLVDRVAAAESKLALVGAAVLPLFTAAQAELVKQLTHFHTPEMDALLVKLGPPYMLTPQEDDRLAVLLKEREQDMGDQISEDERDAARMLPMVMRRAKRESELVAAELVLKVVSVGFVLPEAVQKGLDT